MMCVCIGLVFLCTVFCLCVCAFNECAAGDRLVRDVKLLSLSEATNKGRLLLRTDISSS